MFLDDIGVCTFTCVGQGMRVAMPGLNLKPAREMGLHTIHVKNDDNNGFMHALRQLEQVTCNLSL